MNSTNKFSIDETQIFNPRLGFNKFRKEEDIVIIPAGLRSHFLCYDILRDFKSPGAYVAQLSKHRFAVDQNLQSLNEQREIIPTSTRLSLMELKSKRNVSKKLGLGTYAEMKQYLNNINQVTLETISLTTPRTDDKANYYIQLACRELISMLKDSTGTDITKFIETLYSYVPSINEEEVRVLNGKVSGAFDTFLRKTVDFKGKIQVESITALEQELSNLMKNYQEHHEEMQYGGCVSIEQGDIPFQFFQELQQVIKFMKYPIQRRKYYQSQGEIEMGEIPLLQTKEIMYDVALIVNKYILEHETRTKLILNLCINPSLRSIISKIAIMKNHTPDSPKDFRFKAENAELTTSLRVQMTTPMRAHVTYKRTKQDKLFINEEVLSQWTKGASIIITSDASVIPAIVGGGYTIQYNKHEPAEEYYSEFKRAKKGPQYNSYEAEMLIILQILSMLKNQRNQSIVIFNDNQAAINTLESIRKIEESLLWKQTALYTGQSRAMLQELYKIIQIHKKERLNTLKFIHVKRENNLAADILSKLKQGRDLSEDYQRIDIIPVMKELVSTQIHITENNLTLKMEDSQGNFREWNQEILKRNSFEQMRLAQDIVKTTSRIQIFNKSDIRTHFEIVIPSIEVEQVQQQADNWYLPSEATVMFNGQEVFKNYVRTARMKEWVNKQKKGCGEYFERKILEDQRQQEAIISKFTQKEVNKKSMSKIGIQVIQEEEIEEQVNEMLPEAITQYDFQLPIGRIPVDVLIQQKLVEGRTIEKEQNHLLRRKLRYMFENPIDGGHLMKNILYQQLEIGMMASYFQKVYGIRWQKILKKYMPKERIIQEDLQ